MTLSFLALADSNIWSRGDQIAIWSLAVSTTDIVLAILTLNRGNKNSSVASMIPLNAEIRDAYEQYASYFTSIDFHTLSELEALELKLTSSLERLMNVLEIAAAIEVEGTLSGVSRILMRDYTQRNLYLLIADDYTNTKISNLLQDENTYIFIRRFLRRWPQVSVVLPPAWYAYPEVSLLQRARSYFRY